MEKRVRDDEEVQEQAGAEASLITPRNLLIAVAGFLVMVALVFVVATVLFQMSGRNRQSAEAPFQPRTTPAGPNLQVNEAGDLGALRATQTARLQGYGWVDRDAQRVRIPINRAMDLVVERGYPVFPQVAELPDPDEFTGPAEEPSPDQFAVRGEAVFQEYGCGGCHTQVDTTLAPTLVGLYGTTETLEGGEEVQVDEAYLIDSILNPAAQVVAGFQPIMPSYEGRINEQQLAYLVEYIKSLGVP